MIELKDIERMAARGMDVSEFPEQPNIVEFAAFLAFRSLYKDYSNGRIDKDQAKREKRIIVDIYSRGEIQFRCYMEDTRRRNACSGLLSEMSRSDCPRCRKAAALLDGREKS